MYDPLESSRRLHPDFRVVMLTDADWRGVAWRRWAWCSGIVEPGSAQLQGQWTALRLAFTLPPAQYATMLIRELMKMDTSVGAQAARTVQ